MPVAMERLNIINEMECRMACSSSKVQHIMKFSLQDLQSEMYICGWLKLTFPNDSTAVGEVRSKYIRSFVQKQTGETEFKS